MQYTTVCTTVVHAGLMATILLTACTESMTQPGDPVANVDVAPSSITLTTGQTTQLTATVRDRNNRVITGRPIAWTSDAWGVATVSPNGLVVAHSDGAATITATSEGKTGRATVTVMSSPVPVTSITLDRTFVTLAEGDEIRFLATPRDASGNPLSDRVVTWTSNDAGVASVSSLGIVTGIRAETTTIVASTEGKTATATVVVNANYSYDLVYSGWDDPFAHPRLYVLRFGGGPAQPVLAPDILPDFGFNQSAVSPDGRRIAFVGYQPDAGIAYLFTVNIDGSELRQLTFGGFETQPAWSPEGAKIAYVVRPPNQQGNIWVMNADGTDPVNLTGAMGNLNQYSPAWSRESPAGIRIAFGEGNANYSNIWIMRPDGTERRQITSGSMWWDDDPSWSPDGSRIVFQREGPGTSGSDIWVVDASGANATALVTLPDGQSYPEWSPDGRLIAFNSAHAQDPRDWFVIYTIWSDGTKLARRTRDTLLSIRPAWRVRP